MDYEKLVILVSKAQSGDKDALVEIYKEMYNRVYFYAFKMFANENDAADVVEEVFLKVFTKLDTLEDTHAFPKWLYTITVNECNQKIRKDKKIILIEESEELFEKLLTSEDDETSLRLERKDIKSFLLSLIDLLPDEQKRAVLLYYYEELTVAQISEIEEVAEGTIKTRLSLARKKLRTALEREEKRSGVKLYSFGAPALSSVLTQSASLSPMPLDLAVAALLGALAGAGITGMDSARLLTTNETEDNSFKAKLKQGLIIEIKPFKLVLSLVLIAAIVLGAVLIPKTLNKANDTGIICDELTTVSFENRQGTIDISALPEPIASNATSYATAFYDKKLKEITPVSAYMRMVGGNELYFGFINSFSISDGISFDLWDGCTNLIGFFDDGMNLVGYGLSVEDAYLNGNDYNLYLFTDYESFDKDSIFEEIETTLSKELSKSVKIDTACFYKTHAALPDEDILDLDFELLKDYGLSEDDIAGYSKAWFEADDEEVCSMIAKAEIAMNWVDGDIYMPHTPYNLDGLGLGAYEEGFYYGDPNNAFVQVIVFYDKDNKISAYCYADTNKIITK